MPVASTAPSIPAFKTHTMYQSITIFAKEPVSIAAIVRPGASSLRVNAVKMLFKIKNGENRQQTFK